MYKLSIQNQEDTKEISMVNSWEEVTIGQFIQIEQIATADIPDTYKAVNFVSVLTGESIDYLESLPITVFGRLNNQTNFITTKIPKVTHKDTYELNNRIYKVEADVSAITTSQYIDYQNYIKDGNFINIMSLWLIPEGHKYNDGYDMNRVKLDIESMKLLDVQAVAFFLRTQLAAYILIMKDYSKKEMKKKKASKKDIRQMETLYNNMASSLLL